MSYAEENAELEAELQMLQMELEAEMELEKLNQAEIQMDQTRVELHSYAATKLEESVNSCKKQGEEIYNQNRDQISFLEDK